MHCDTVILTQSLSVHFNLQLNVICITSITIYYFIAQYVEYAGEIPPSAGHKL